MQGWASFLTAKASMLAKYDQGREHARAHSVQTHHGRVAEAEFRHWLADFLPKRYGVTSGYIVSQFARDTTKLPHYDVLIYDHLESPTLWIENHSDVSSGGAARALPVEHVLAVIEVKSSFELATVRDAQAHLRDLEPLLARIDASHEPLKQFLPPSFFSAIVFYELRTAHEYDTAALLSMFPETRQRGYLGGLILRGAGLPPRLAGRTVVGVSTEPTQNTVERGARSLLSAPLARLESISDTDGTHYVPSLMWTSIGFAHFAFDLLALLKGTYDPGRMSSQYALSWLDNSDEGGE
jgi:hypothetical protein